MVKNATTTGNEKEITRWARLGEESFADFFGKKLPREGFIIEESAHEYFIVMNQLNGLPLGHDASFADELREKV
ncbi:MAG TPA: hypothetical protein DGH68_06130 [Bacteroidetes bacterium]|jgi:hypothetical protein|nr:hypothetical protein [Bacteroidota bacterium]